MSSSSTSGNSNDAQQQCNNRVGRGRELLAFMSTQTLVSDWDGDPIKTFEKYGYIPKRQSDVLPDNPERERVYTELGISLSTNRWATMQVDHLNKYTISFQDKVTKKMKTETYNPTGTWFKIQMNAQAGFLTAMSSRGMDMNLKSWADNKFPVPTKPDSMLEKWSDCAYLMWKHDCQEQNVPVSNIKYFFQEKIQNDTTGKVLEVVLAKRGIAMYKLGKWPGITISTSTDDGKALLGCPSGFGPAYFLAEHRASLGRKKITEVQFWKVGNFPDMLFRVSPA